MSVNWKNNYQVLSLFLFFGDFITLVFTFLGLILITLFLLPLLSVVVVNIAILAHSGCVEFIM